MIELFKSLMRRKREDLWRRIFPEMAEIERCRKAHGKTRDAISRQRAAVVNALAGRKVI